MGSKRYFRIGLPAAIVLPLAAVLVNSGNAVTSPLPESSELRAETIVIVLGDSVSGTIATQSERDTFHIELQAGDTVDLGLFSSGESGAFVPLLGFYGPTGDRIARSFDFRSDNGAAILPAQVIQADGMYSLIVSVSTCCGGPGDYVLKTRASGPVVVTNPVRIQRISAREGGHPARDTLFVYNAGSGSTSFRVDTNGASWLTVSPPSGTLQAGRSADSVPVEIVVDPRISSPFFGEVIVRLPDDSWGGPADIRIIMKVFDAAIELVASDLDSRTWGVAEHPSGDVLVTIGDDIVRIDSATGQHSIEFDDLGFSLRGIDYGPDGSLYVTDTSGRLFRVRPGVGVDTILQVADAEIYLADVAAAADGNVYTVSESKIYKIAPDGTTTPLVIEEAIGRGIGYNPLDGYLYFGDRPYLKRVDPGTGMIETVADIGYEVVSIEVGQSGRMYIRAFRNILVLSLSGQILQSFTTPGNGGWGLALTDGELYGAANEEDRGIVFRLPLDDSPATARPETGVRLAVIPPGDSLTRIGSTPVHVRIYLDSVDAMIGAASGRVTLDPDAVVVDSIVAGNYGGTLAADIGMQADSGYIRFAVANDAPPAMDTLNLARVYVSAVTDNGAASPLAVWLDDLVDTNGGDLLSKISESSNAAVRNAIGVWGDVDFTYRLTPQRDALNARDALICLGAVVGKNVGAFDATACDVVPDGGGQYTGTVSARDALAILKEVVGLHTSGLRVGAYRGSGSTTAGAALAAEVGRTHKTSRKMGSHDRRER